jgi:acetolactate synthase I/II/III large subunit
LLTSERIDALAAHLHQSIYNKKHQYQKNSLNKFHPMTNMHSGGGPILRDHQTLCGANALVTALKDAGVRCIFSLSGNQIMPVYDALLGSGIRLVHVRHEASAVYMAEAWAQLTGEPGVALVTAGAGFGNALGALISAQASESPLLLLSGDSPRAQDGTGAFQEMDQVAMSKPVTKLALRVSAANKLGPDVTLALCTAQAGRPGPVHLALPADVLTDTLNDTPLPAPTLPSAQPLGDDDAQSLALFLHGARFPLVLTGPTLSKTRAGASISDLQNALGTPVLCMESPRGLRDPSLGALLDLTRQADRILLLGKAPDFTTGFLGPDMGAAGAIFAMVDPDATMIARAQAKLGPRLHHAVKADMSFAVTTLVTNALPPPDRADWLAKATGAISRRADVADMSTTTLHPAHIGAEVQASLAASPQPILICDGGEFGQWMQAIAHDGPRVINGVSGAIGAAPAYAIAASIAFPDATIIATMGDGTAGFLLAEYETAAREGARFTALIGNDDCWNAEHQIQIREYGADRTHGCILSPAVRYDLAAAALGVKGAFVGSGDRGELRAALADAVACPVATCINVRTYSAPAPVVPTAAPAPTAVH